MPASATESQLIVQGILLFLGTGILMVLAPLVLGQLVRRQLPHPVKAQPYECGEPAVGSPWGQFDARIYVAALVFLIFDVEIALFYPWAVVLRAAGWLGLIDILFFFGVLVVGFAYLWRFGALDWVRSAAGQRGATPSDTEARQLQPPHQSLALKSTTAVGQAQAYAISAASSAAAEPMRNR